MSKKMYTVTESGFQLNILVNRLDANRFEIGFSYFEKSPEKRFSYIDCENRIFKSEYYGFVFTAKKAKAFLEKINAPKKLAAALIEKYNTENQLELDFGVFK